jgi:hypothetical protein
MGIELGNDVEHSSPSRRCKTEYVGLCSWNRSFGSAHSFAVSWVAVRGSMFCFRMTSQTGSSWIQTSTRYLWILCPCNKNSSRFRGSLCCLCVRLQHLKFLLFPSSAILGNRGHDVSETGSVSVFRWERKTPTQLGPLERANLWYLFPPSGEKGRHLSWAPQNAWLRLALSKGPNWVGVFHSRPKTETNPVSETSCPLLHRVASIIWNSGQWKKSKKPIILPNHFPLNFLQPVTTWRTRELWETAGAMAQLSVVQKWLVAVLVDFRKKELDVFC